MSNRFRDVPNAKRMGNKVFSKNKNNQTYFSKRVYAF